ncbi:MAG: hypothetical protein K6F42_01720 [Bacteroidales bacterium]|nr:hypothetical protein [Bacteroidales bacterium]
MASAIFAFSACDKEQLPDKPAGTPLTIRATVGAQTKTAYFYDSESRVMDVTWSEEESISVISFDASGITAIDDFTSSGEEGRDKAEFTGTWNGYPGDRVICLYPALSTTAGSRLFGTVSVGDASIPLNSLPNSVGTIVKENPSSLAGADVMVGDVVISGSTASVNLVRQICVFRLTVTCSTTAWYDDYYERVSTVKISVDNAGTPAVIATAGALDVTTDTYTGSFAAIAYGTIKYTLNDFYSSDLNTSGGPKTQVFYAPIFSEGDLEEGYTLRFHYGGRSKEGWGASWESVETFGGGCVQNKTVTEKRTLEKGKIYGFTMTI